MIIIFSKLRLEMIIFFFNFVFLQLQLIFVFKPHLIGLWYFEIFGMTITLSPGKVPSKSQESKPEVLFVSDLSNLGI